MSISVKYKKNTFIAWEEQSWQSAEFTVVPTDCHVAKLLAMMDYINEILINHIGRRAHRGEKAINLLSLCVCIHGDVDCSHPEELEIFDRAAVEFFQDVPRIWPLHLEAIA